MAIDAVVTGYLGSDGDLTHVGTEGTPVVNFRIGSNNGGDKGTTWVGCSIFGERSKKLAVHLTKGKHVKCVGEMRTREFESGGQKRLSLDMRVDRVEFLSAKEDSAGSTDFP